MLDRMERKNSSHPYRWRGRDGEIDMYMTVRSSKYTEKDLIRDIKTGNAAFLEMSLFMSSHNYCCNPGCTTCGGHGARKILSQLTEEDVVHLVERSDTASASWYEITVQILRLYPKEWIAHTNTYRMYCMANEMFDKLVYKYCWRPRKAWVEVEKMIDSGGRDCWMDLESAKM